MRRFFALMSRTIARGATVASLVAVVLLAPSAAFAVTGTVSGTWQFWLKAGNYCPTTNACTGARYLQASFNTRIPVSNGSVWIVNNASGTLLGYGGTDVNGNFTVSWSAATTPPQIRIVIFPYEKNGRLFFTNPAGTLYSNSTPAQTTVTPSMNIGTWWMGTSAAPDPYYNSYWAAEYQWRSTLALIGSAITNYTNVENRGFQNDISSFLGNCPNSCSDGPNKRVQFDAGAGLAPQARAMHENGHIAEYVAHAWSRTMNYNWPDMSTFSASGPWSPGGAEWGAPAFEEALATHYGNIAFWGDNAVTPTTCSTNGICYDGSGNPSANTNIEATSYPFTVNNCSLAMANPEARWPLSYMRYLWDVFDNRNDCDGDTYSASQGDFWKHLSVLANYANGTGANAIDESQVKRDGRGAGAYRFNYETAFSVGTETLRVDNCSPP